MLSSRHACLLLLYGVAGWLAPIPAHAELGGSAVFASDYLLRGVSLSDAKPAAQLALNYDHVDGWFGGAMLSNVILYGARRSPLLQGYAGYARRAGDGLSWELGASRSGFSALHHYDYHEWFAGVAGQEWESRIYYAPAYFGYAGKTVYGEWNAVQPLRDSLRLQLHLGGLRQCGGARMPGLGTRSQFDSRIGVALDIGQWGATLAWAALSRNGIYPVEENAARNKMVLSLSRSF